jgi:hypothetical protein
MHHPLSCDEIPVCETTDEKNSIWKKCEQAGEPFVILEKVEMGFMPKYDLYTTDKNLTDGAASEVRERMDEWIEIYTAELEDNRFNREELSWHAGKCSGAIWPLEKEEALKFAEEMSEIVSEEDNVKKISARDAFFTDIN